MANIRPTLKEAFNMNGFVWLVGDRLPRLYEKYFGLKPTARSVRDCEPDTPYVRFAEKVLKKMSITKSNGKPYSREYIATVMSYAARGGRKRGKSVS
jgi:hypothetical protein